MAAQNFIFSMKSYDVEVLSNQVAWMLEKRTELASRKRLSGLWKITDKLNAVPRASEAELKRRKERKKIWGGLLLVMGIFLFVPGAMKPQELPVPLVAGFLAIILGVLYMRKDDRKKNAFEKQATQLLEKLNTSMENQKLRLVFGDEEFTMSGAGADQKVSYDSVEGTFETADLFCLVFDNQIVLLQKKELLLGTAEDLERRLEESKKLYFAKMYFE